MVAALTILTLCSSGLAAALFLRNMALFRRAADFAAALDNLPQVSVLIPARNEARTIEQTVTAALASQGAVIEVVVLDDHSTDDTPRIVAQLAERDERVRLVSGLDLPSGWCGKQYACQQLAGHARYDELMFLDADVRVTPDAVQRAMLERRRLNVDLLSGFPRQVTHTWGEALLLPLIHVVLLTFLPFQRMRTTRQPAASAGCGQLLLTSREAYQRSGGHQAIKYSLHDGIMLPRAYRVAGLLTDIFDASDIARCRMYAGFRQTCAGLMKNAHEGIANARLIVPTTIMLAAVFILPPVLAVHQAIWPASSWTLVASVIAAAVSYGPRLGVAVRFDRQWMSAALGPAAVAVFIILQWAAFGARRVGIRPAWRGRSYTLPTR